MGADDAYVAQAMASLPPDEPDDSQAFDVYPENWETVLLFLSLRTQWRIGPMGGLMGLEYPGVEVVIRRRRIKDRDAMFAHIQAMESAALAAIEEDSDVR